MSLLARLERALRRRRFYTDLRLLEEHPSERVIRRLGESGSPEAAAAVIRGLNRQGALTPLLREALSTLEKIGPAWTSGPEARKAIAPLVRLLAAASESGANARIEKLLVAIDPAWPRSGEAQSCIPDIKQLLYDNTFHRAQVLMDLGVEEGRTTLLCTYLLGDRKRIDEAFSRRDPNWRSHPETARAIGVVLGWMCDPFWSADQRRTAFQSLSELDSQWRSRPEVRAAIPRLAQIGLKEPAKWQNASVVLDQIDPEWRSSPECRPVIEEHLMVFEGSSPPLPARWEDALNALVSLKALRDPSVVSLLARHPETGVRYMAVRALEREGSSGVPALAEIAGGDTDPDVAQYAIQALMRVKHPDGILPLFRWFLARPAERASLLATFREIDPAWILRPELRPEIPRLIERLVAEPAGEDWSESLREDAAAAAEELEISAELKERIQAAAMRAWERSEALLRGGSVEQRRRGIARLARTTGTRAAEVLEDRLVCEIDAGIRGVIVGSLEARGWKPATDAHRAAVALVKRDEDALQSCLPGAREFLEFVGGIENRDSTSASMAIGALFDYLNANTYVASEAREFGIWVLRHYNDAGIVQVLGTLERQFQRNQRGSLSREEDELSPDWRKIWWIGAALLDNGGIGRMRRIGGDLYHSPNGLGYVVNMIWAGIGGWAP